MEYSESTGLYTGLPNAVHTVGLYGIDFCHIFLECVSGYSCLIQRPRGWLAVLLACEGCDGCRALHLLVLSYTVLLTASSPMSYEVDMPLDHITLTQFLL